QHGVRGTRCLRVLGVGRQRGAQPRVGLAGVVGEARVGDVAGRSGHRSILSAGGARRRGARLGGWTHAPGKRLRQRLRPYDVAGPDRPPHRPGTGGGRAAVAPPWSGGRPACVRPDPAPGRGLPHRRDPDAVADRRRGRVLRGAADVQPDGLDRGRPGRTGRGAVGARGIPEQPQERPYLGGTGRGCGPPPGRAEADRRCRSRGEVRCGRGGHRRRDRRSRRHRGHPAPARDRVMAAQRMVMGGSPRERDALATRLTRAVAALDPAPGPRYVIDLDAFDANADDLLRRAQGTPIRVASKSVRVPALLRRVLARDGFAGVLAYTLAEALHLQSTGVADDIVLGYPTVDRGSLATLLQDPAAAAAITLITDDVAHLDLVDRVRSDLPSAASTVVRVAID